METGGAVKLATTLNTLPTALSLSWQLTYPRFHVRFGIPLNPGNPLSTTQAFTFYWVLGPKPKRARGEQPASND